MNQNERETGFHGAAIDGSRNLTIEGWQAPTHRRVGMGAPVDQLLVVVS